MLNRGREDVESIDNAVEARRPDDTMAGGSRSGTTVAKNEGCTSVERR
jgi:hypothetical protein